MDTRALASDSYALSDWRAPDLTPLVEVEHRNGMRWTIPQTTSAYLYQTFMLREKTDYAWDWGSTRAGSWRPNTQVTTASRYVICFQKMVQTNVDNNRQRAVRLVWKRVGDHNPQRTGEVPRSSSAWLGDS